MRTLRMRVIVAFVGLLAAGAAWPQQRRHNGPGDWLRGIPSGKTQVVDLSYAINDKLPAWPGASRVFEATVLATPEKDGYFMRSF